VQEKILPEAFIRLSLGDEDGRKLFWGDWSGALKDRIRSSLLNGINVNGTLYRFLAYSSSQVQEGSV
jgi:hypothetical protein